MIKNLVISALGNDKPGLVNQLSKTILDQGGNISESRMMVLGGEFSIMLLVTGNQDCINNINSKLEEIDKNVYPIKLPSCPWIILASYITLPIFYPVEI